MEALLVRQKEILTTVQQIKTNFGKDSSHRKTSEYLEKRISTLDSLWAEFNQNNAQLNLAVDKSGEYFTKNIYADAKKLYDEIRNTLTNYEGDGERKLDPEVQEFLSEQRTNFRALQRSINSIDCDSLTEKWELEDELRNLQKHWNNIDILHLKIDNILMGSDANYEEEYTINEKKFKAIKRVLNQKITSNIHLSESTPKIEIPVFHGEYSQWPTFLDLFKSSIHDNNTLTKAQKMQHLKTKLKGEAQRLIQHLHVSSDNYDAAWDLLCHRYNNQLLLFTNRIEIFLNQPVVQKQTSQELKKLHDTTMECIHAIHNLGVDTTTWDPLLVHLLLQKLDTDTRSDYREARESPRDLPTLGEFTAFLESKFTALEPIGKKEREESSPTKQATSSKGNDKSGKSKPGKFPYKNKADRNYVSCVVCNNATHTLFQCRKFGAMTPDASLKIVTDNNVCKNCLYLHERNICKSTKRCKTCNEQHNTLLHDSLADLDTPESATAGTSKSQRKQNANHVMSEDDEILLTTVLIQVRANDNTYIKLRALLDQGSQVTLITENAAQRLGLARRHLSASVSGVGTTTKRGKGIIHLDCKSIHDDYSFSTNAVIMPKLINSLPNTTFDKKANSHIQHIQLADPEYNVSKPIDILLDAKIYADIIMGGLIKGSDKQPIAQQTRLGWILSGKVKTLNCNVVINNLDGITNYWEMEEIMNDSSTLTQQEQFCEELYVSTTGRLPDGKYEVRLPMKENFMTQLGESKARALAQFKQLEQRLKKNDKLKKSYQQFMQEYIDLGHMKECTQSAKVNCYLPHHGVHKEDSTTTKLRVVFNASSKTTTGNSLNDLMECGPKLQQDIQDLLLRRRTYQYVYTADCEKMYRCILIQEDQQHLQKILWRNNAEENLKEYQLCTVTYGMKAAPYLAMRTMQQLAKDDAPTYPLAAKALQRDFYVDDLISGNDTLETAQEVQKQLIKMLSGAGINLRKWSSNTPQLLSELAPEQINPSILDFKNANSTKALGLRWNPSTDVFTFQNIDKQNYAIYTKRNLLSEISQIFDPLGWLSPLTVRAKLLFQKVWLVNLNWDDIVPSEIQQEWDKLRIDMQNLDKINIPRWIGNFKFATELHGFCDSSEKAYACVIYLKSTNDNDESYTRLIAAKTKLAPRNKPITLPRLELCGAVLLTNLMKKVIRALPRSDIPVFGWTDSLVVLGWLQGNPSRWKTFVANRTKEILQTMPASCWRYVSSQDNAADCATRGLTATQLNQHPLWWSGSNCIQANVSSDLPKIDMPQIEMKPEKHCCATKISMTIIDELLQKHSSISHVTRVIAYVSRFISILRHRMTRNQPLRSKHDTLSGLHTTSYEATSLTVKEIEHASQIIIRSVQSREFETDITSLKQKKNVSARSNLLTLNPYLDEHRILRVNGRLQNSHLPEDAKYPIIIPKKSRLTELLIRHAHLQTLHGGPRLKLTYLRQKYWIVGGNNTVKGYLKSCVTCLRFSHKKFNQIMSSLPEARVTPSRPFTHTGVDFTGQVELKMNKGRGIKTCRGYLSVFICLATKAIHLELVSDLSTPAFLAAFKRMCARRGSPKHIYSDNGTNFVGAAKVLKKEFKLLKLTIDANFLSDMSDMGITWHFNAPAWPSGGGIWEAAVKSTKHHLKRVLGEQKLTFEEFSTLLTQIEACLNSRPLYALTENPEDEVLTPGHFLVGGPLLGPPITDNDTTCIRTRWQMTEKMHRDFWKRWSSEYLQHLQTRSKWHKVKENLKRDDVVIIKEENLPPTKWALGRVVETHAGADGNIRVVTLKTKNGEMKRPILKLVPLPTQETHSSTTSEQEVKDDGNDKPKPRRQPLRTRRKPNFLISALLLLLTIFTRTINASYSIGGINSSNTLYFDKISDLRIIQDQWKMVIYYNMTTYWQSMTVIEDYIQFVKESCKNDHACVPTVTQLDHELEELRHYNNLLTGQHTMQRSKRGLINGIGNLANTLFGVLDDKFAQKYETDIRMIQKREDHILKLFKNQTTILEAENNILKRNELIMNRQFENINQHMQQIQSEVNQVQSNSRNALHAFHILSSLISADVVLSNLRRIQEALLDTVTDIYHGRISIHLLPPEQIQQQLNTISGHLQDDLIIPADNVRDLYSLLHIQAKVSKKFLIMEIKIPLLNRDMFELDRVIDIPQKRGKHSVYTSTETTYLATNVKKDTIIPMTETDIPTCIPHKSQLFCPLNHPIYTLQMGESICDVRLLIGSENKSYCRSQIRNCTDRWIKLRSRDTWFYSCCTECTIRILCSDEVITKALHDNGFLTLDHGCTIRGESFIIHSQHDYMNQIFMQQEIDINLNTPKESRLNDIMNTSLPKRFDIEHHDQAFHNIQQDIDSLKSQELEPLTSSDYIHHSVIYTMLFVVICTLMTFLYCNLKNRCQKFELNEKRKPSANPTSNIEMVEVDRTCAASRAAPQPAARHVDTRDSGHHDDDMTSSAPAPRRISFSLNN